MFYVFAAANTRAMNSGSVLALYHIPTPPSRPDNQYDGDKLQRFRRKEMYSLVVKITCSVAAEARCHRVATNDLPSLSTGRVEIRSRPRHFPTGAVAVAWFAYPPSEPSENDPDILPDEHTQQCTAPTLLYTFA